MRVLMTTSDYSGHWFPMVPAGWALQAAGHEVRVACAPSQEAAVSAAGLVPLPVLGGPDMLERGRIFYFFAAQQGGVGRLGMPLHPVTGEVMTSLSDFDWPAYKRANRDRNIAAGRASVDAITEFTKDWRPDLVMHDVLSLEGVLAGQVAKVPAVCHLWGAIGTAETDPGVDLIPRDHNNDFGRLGLPPMHADLIRYAVDPCPPEIAAPTCATRLPVRYVPYNGPGSDPLLPPRTGGRPRVAVVWGNSLTGLIGPRSFLVPAILAALSTLEVDVLLACDPKAAAGLESVPDNVSVLGYVPMRTLLPECDAVVHHGGAGCAMTTVGAGKPQLALPFTPEQAAHAERVGAAAGVVCDGASADRAAIRDAVEQLLSDPAYQDAASALRESMAARPSPAELVGVLERIAAREL